MHKLCFWIQILQSYYSIGILRPNDLISMQEQSQNQGRLIKYSNLNSTGITTSSIMHTLPQFLEYSINSTGMSRSFILNTVPEFIEYSIRSSDYSDFNSTGTSRSHILHTVLEFMRYSIGLSDFCDVN